MRRVAVLFTGGTISSVTDPAAGGHVPTLGASELIERVPGLDAIAGLDIVDVGRRPASHFRLGDLVSLAQRVDDALAAPDVVGAVVVQGTDTIEETSFALDLAVRSDRPVVVTGAMRAASEEGYDGPVNLRDAVTAAASPLLDGQGTVVLLDGALHPADDVVKTHASAYGTFQSPNLGPIGHVAAGKLSVARRRGPRRRVATASAAERVHLVTVVVGMDGALLDAAVASGADGIVVAATGTGNTTPQLLAAAERAMGEGIPVALTTRCVAGRATGAYAFPGGGAEWFRAGALPTGYLGGPKARVALALGLGAGLDRAGLAALLADPGERADGAAPTGDA
jgi:L-asparaginase